MGLPYEDATSGERALNDIRKVLTRFGCTRFGTMTDNELGELLVQFTYRGRNVSVKANFKGYAAAWLEEHPYRSQYHRGGIAKHEAKALEQAQVSVYSILRDWIKGQITAVEVGVLTFDGAFLGQLLLASGQTVLERIETDNLLPAPKDA